MPEFIPDKGISSEGEGTVCHRIMQSSSEDIINMLEEQSDMKVEVWRLFMEIGSNVKETNMEYGTETEISDEKIVNKVEDLTIPGVDKVHLVHTHPRGMFLSPTDIQMHLDTVSHIDEYGATMGVATRTGIVDLFAVQGGGDMDKNESLDLMGRLMDYWDRMNEADGAAELYSISEDMFVEMDEHLNFCRYRYKVQ